jgi:hypothetical protein
VRIVHLHAAASYLSSAEPVNSLTPTNPLPLTNKHPLNQTPPSLVPAAPVKKKFKDLLPSHHILAYSSNPLSFSLQDHGVQRSLFRYDPDTCVASLTITVLDCACEVSWHVEVTGKPKLHVDVVRRKGMTGAMCQDGCLRRLCDTIVKRGLRDILKRLRQWPRGSS